MFPLTKTSQTAPPFEELAKRRSDFASLATNAEGWAHHGFHALDEYCNILKIRQSTQSILKDAIASPRFYELLREGEGTLTTLLSERQCP